MAAILKAGEEKNRIAECSDQSADNESELFAVAGIIGWKNDDVGWAVCQRLKSTDEKALHWRVGHTDVSRLQLVKLGRNVRRAACFHKCNDACGVDLKNRKASHNGTIMTGELYKIASIHEGYPPRMA